MKQVQINQMKQTTMKKKTNENEKNDMSDIIHVNPNQQLSNANPLMSNAISLSTWHCWIQQGTQQQ